MQKKLFNLKNTLKLNDGHRICRDFLPDAKSYLTWHDVEYALNSGKYYTDIISDGRHVDVDVSKYFWHDHRSQNKEQLFDLINNGHTFSITCFSLYNKLISSLVNDIETIFPVMCDVHVYGGIGRKGSFFPHIDIPSNFIIQIEGTTVWRLYDNTASDLLLQEEINNTFDPSTLTVEHEVELSPGDMLYIPARKFHAAFPEGKRLSLSIPCRSLKYNTEGSKKLDRAYYNVN
jgi:hypothetical protein